MTYRQILGDIRILMNWNHLAGKPWFMVPPFSAPCLSSGTTTVTSSVAVSLKTWRQDWLCSSSCSRPQYSEDYSKVSHLSDRKMNFTLTLLCYSAPLGFHTSDGDVSRPAAFHFAVAAGDLLAASHESERDFKITSRVCFTLLAKTRWTEFNPGNKRQEV